MNKIQNVLFIIFLVYATIFKLFNSGGINLLVVYFVPLLLVTILISNKTASKQLFLKKYLPILAFAGYYLLSSFINIHALRLSSLLYSLDLILCFYLYFHLLRKNINLSVYRKWLITIIKVFFFALIIQQIGIILGIHDFFNRLDSTRYEIERNFIFSLNSLSTEPSYASTIISVCLFSLLKIESAESNDRYSIKDIKRDYLIWLMYFYQLIFYRSVFGILFLIIIIFQFINLKKTISWILLSLLITCFMVINIDFEALNRLKIILEGIDLRNIDKLTQLDHSGSIRVLPFYYYLINFNTFDIHSYIGFGLDYSQKHLQAIIPGIEEGAAFGGLIPILIFDFGIIGILLLWRMILKLIIFHLFSFETIILFFVMVNAALNTQLLWFVLIVFSINRIIISALKLENEPKIP